MFFYIYMIFMVGVFSYYLYRDSMIYRKGEYSPYIFSGRGKNDLPFWKNFMITLLLGFGASPILRDDNHENKIIFFITFIIIILIAIVQGIILKYLSYKKSKDKDIIIFTLIYTVILIALMVLLWKIGDYPYNIFSGFNLSIY